MPKRPASKTGNVRPGGFSLINKKARHDYSLSDTLEAGLVLQGPEIKALRAHRAQIEAGYVRILGGEAWLLGAHLRVADGDPHRSIKLLLKKPELNRLIGTVQEKGLTILPLKLYEKQGRAKLEIGIGRGKKRYEHRAELKARGEQREARRALKKDLT